ncbi:hypothetical protein HZ326_30365 [Fusarium oxysporum f. sp. albedinis]|nr:hypothetical protein HZ326_30365 [Fusarium oxysporum f. sp. albedinis]
MPRNFRVASMTSRGRWRLTATPPTEPTIPILPWITGKIWHLLRQARLLAGRWVLLLTRTQELVSRRRSCHAWHYKPASNNSTVTHFGPRNND